MAARARAVSARLAVRRRRRRGEFRVRVLYGELFGPTHVLPVVWLAPLDQPVRLLEAAVGVGAVLLGGAYATMCAPSA
jgi:hypothetical protein